MFRPIARLIVCCVLCLTAATPLALAQPSAAPAAKAKPRAKEDSQQRDKSLNRIADRLEIRAGSVIADIGAGAGRDSWTFAQIVGTSGKVYSVEIEKSKVDALTKEAAKRKWPRSSLFWERPTIPACRPLVSTWPSCTTSIIT
jgi:predicted methyltransferase